MDGDRSPTQRTLTRDDVEHYIESSFDRPPAVVECAPMAGGWFSAV